MNTKGATSLWRNSTRSACSSASLSHYYLIPDDQEIKSGDFPIHTLNGKEKKVSLTAIAAFEITESEAKAHLQAEMNQAMEQAKTASFNLMAFSVQTSQPNSSKSSPPSDQTQTVQNLISTLLGFTPEELQNNPDAAQAAFLKLYTGIKDLVSDSTSKNPTQFEAVRKRLQSLRETLQAQGIDMSEDIEKELPEKLGEFFSSTEIEKYLQEIVAKLRELADQIDQSPESVGQKIDQPIQSLSQDLFIEEEKRLEQKRKQDYQKSAQDAIAASFKALALPSFAGGDFTTPKSPT